MTGTPHLDDATVAGLVAALTDAGYTVDGMAERLGPVAHGALTRNETTPALRATAGGDPLDTLIRLWPLQRAVSVAAAEGALPGLVAPLCEGGLLRRVGDEVAALLDLSVYADDEHGWWLLSDLTPTLDGVTRRVAADYVVGMSGASTSLAQLTWRRHVGRALDLGTGCGLQALHLTRHCEQVVAHRREPSRARADPAQRPSERRRPRPAGGQPLRARRG